MSPRPHGHIETTIAERALTGLVDYHCLLVERAQRGTSERMSRHRRNLRRRGRQFKGEGTSGGNALRFEASRAERECGADKSAISRVSESAVREATRWEVEREREWGHAGRLTPDGRLRMSGQYLRWTLDAVGNAFPELRQFDRLAALILLDGQVEEGWMDAQENIRAVIDEIVDIRIARIFGQVLIDLRSLGGQAGALASPQDGAGGVTYGRRRRSKRVHHPKTGKMVLREDLERELRGPGIGDAAHERAGKGA